MYKSEFWPAMVCPLLTQSGHHHTAQFHPDIRTPAALGVSLDFMEIHIAQPFGEY